MYELDFFLSTPFVSSVMIPCFFPSKALLRGLVHSLQHGCFELLDMRRLVLRGFILTCLGLRHSCLSLLQDMDQ